MAKNMTKNKIQQEFEEWCLEKLKSCENIQEAVDIVKLYENAMGDNKCGTITYNGVGIRGGNILTCEQHTNDTHARDIGDIKLN